MKESIVGTIQNLTTNLLHGNAHDEAGTLYRYQVFYKPVHSKPVPALGLKLNRSQLIPWEFHCPGTGPPLLALAA